MNPTTLPETLMTAPAVGSNPIAGLDPATLQALFKSMSSGKFCIENHWICLYAKDVTAAGVTLYGSVLIQDYGRGCDQDREDFDFPVLWSDFEPGVDAMGMLTRRAKEAAAQAKVEQEAAEAAEAARDAAEQAERMAEAAAREREQEWATYQRLKEKFNQAVV